MATEFYNLPTVNNEKNTFSFVDSVNGLATSVDETMEQIVDGFRAHPYHLPTATKQQLGGVRIGDGWDVYSDGEITPKDSKYVLPKATNETLGGIIAGQNIICEEGKISLDEGAYKLTDYETEMFRDEAVTTDKLADSSILSDGCIPTIPAQLYKLVNSFTSWERLLFTLSSNSSYKDSWQVQLRGIGGAYIVTLVRPNAYIPISDGESVNISDSYSAGSYWSKDGVKFSELFPNTQSIILPLGLWNYNGKGLNAYGYVEIIPSQNSGYIRLGGTAKGAKNIVGPQRRGYSDLLCNSAGANNSSAIVFAER